MAPRFKELVWSTSIVSNSVGQSWTKSFWVMPLKVAMGQIKWQTSHWVLVDDQTSIPTKHTTWACHSACCKSTERSTGNLKLLLLSSALFKQETSIVCVYGKLASQLSEYRGHVMSTWSHQRTIQGSLMIQQECPFGWLWSWNAFHWSGYLSVPPVHPSRHTLPFALHWLAGYGPAKHETNCFEFST
jgi:hypothetical protein